MQLLLFVCSCVFACQVGMLLKRDGAEIVSFVNFPSTSLLSLVIHDKRRRNKLHGLGCRQELFSGTGSSDLERLGAETLYLLGML